MVLRRMASCDEENKGDVNQSGKHPRLENVRIILDERAIYSRATDYLHYDHPYSGIILRDLPPFDDTARFGITVEDENANLREEIRRLVHYASQPGEPALFDSFGALGSADLAGYSDLNAIADQIYCALEIIRHDNVSLAISHYMNASQFKELTTSRKALRTKYLAIPAGTTGNLPRILPEKKRNMIAYHALLDHIFHSLAWWIVRVTVARTFSNHYLAVLARWSVKLKTIALNPEQWAEDSLARAEDLLRQVSSQQQSEDITRLDLMEDNPENSHKTLVIFPNDQDLDIHYYNEKSTFRSELFNVIVGLLGAFNASYSSEGEPSMQVRTLLFRGGLEQELRHFTTHGDSLIETSSYLMDIRRTYPALKLLLAQSHQVARADTGQAAESSWPARVQWSCKLPGGEPDEDTIETHRLDHFVSLLTPVAIAACSDSLASMDRQLSRFAGPLKERGPSQVALQLSVEDFPRIEVSLSTTRQSHGVSWDAGADSEVLSPSKAPLMAFEDAGNLTGSDPDSSECVLRRKVTEVLDAYDRRRAEISSWTVTQDAVRVSTRRYSSAALAIAGGIILGSIPLPFVIGERITGVDPFQLVTFSWLVVGAFLVGAKSRYVENWPWHDFLRMQVVCHSVTELAKAARVDEQAVILHLLFHEYRHPLVFSGPYPGVFRHQKDSGGFNVDVPTRHETVVAAGFIVIEALEKIPLSDKWEHRTIMQDTREGKDGQRLGFQVSEMAAEVAGKRRLVRIKDTDEERGWMVGEHKVIGLSTRDWAFT